MMHLSFFRSLVRSLSPVFPFSAVFSSFPFSKTKLKREQAARVAGDSIDNGPPLNYARSGRQETKRLLLRVAHTVALLQTPTSRRVSLYRRCTVNTRSCQLEELETASDTNGNKKKEEKGREEVKKFTTHTSYDLFR